MKNQNLLQTGPGNWICILLSQPPVIKGGANDMDKPIKEEFFYCKKETAEWIKKYLTYSNGDTKDAKHLKLASNPNTYTVTDYHSYVPIQVKTPPMHMLLGFITNIKVTTLNLLKT